MKIRIVNQSNNELPAYQTTGSAGMDLHAFIDEKIELAPLERILIPTGLFIELEDGTEAQIRPRSGLAYKQGITVLNSPGTIDSDYRGELKVLLVNLSNDKFIINSGERIAQMVFTNFEQPALIQVDNLTITDRGAKGFGSTGVK